MAMMTSMSFKDKYYYFMNNLDKAVYVYIRYLIQIYITISIFTSLSLLYYIFNILSQQIVSFLAHQNRCQI